MPRRGPGFFVGNTIKAPYCTISAADPTYEPAGFEATFLKTEKPSDTARISTLDPLKTRWSASVEKANSRDFYALVAVHSNISPWGLYRYTNTPPDWQSIPPTLVFSSTNMTGAATDVDEAVTAIDANYMTPTNPALDWSVRLSGYATPAQTPTSKIIIPISVKLEGTPTNTNPKVSATLYQSGTIVEILGYRAITESTDQVLIFSCFAFQLPDSSGANMRVNLAFQPGDNGSYAKLGTALIYTEGAAPTLDSGWLDSPIFDIDPDDSSPPSVDLSFYPNFWETINLNLSILDDQVEHDPDLGSSPSGVPVNNVDPEKWLDGYIEAGVWFAGDAIFISSVGMTVQDRGPRSSIHIEEIGGVSGGGQSRGTDLFRQRRCRLDFISSRDELLSLQRRIAWGRGKSGAFYFAAEPDLPVKYQVFSSFWCTLQDMGEPELVLTADDTDDGGVLHRVSMTLLEKI